ncbi:MAG: DsbC/DsbD-like thiol-disulfide interchange protein, partial [Gammaproteobacteria bacterium]
MKWKRSSLTIAIGCATLLGLQGNAQAEAQSQGDGPVSVSANITAVPEHANMHRVTVALDIMPGWHTYAKVAEGDPAPITSVELELPDGTHQVGEWTVPEGVSYAGNAKILVYEGSVAFSAIVATDFAGPERPIGISVALQICNEVLCYPPDKLTTQVRIPGAVADDATTESSLFEAPLMLFVDAAPLNSKAKQMYPSPGLFDIDNDGRDELIIGDIFGAMNV